MYNKNNLSNTIPSEQCKNLIRQQPPTESLSPDQTNESHSQSIQIENNTKIPPIILKRRDWRKTEGKLMTTISTDSLQAKTFGLDSIILQRINIGTFRLIQSCLTESNTDFHIFSLPEEKPSKYLERVSLGI